MSSDSAAASYELLARTFERELELLGAHDFEALSLLLSERRALIESLPAEPPAFARPALARAALLNKRVEIELLRHREALLIEAAHVEQVGRTARGYTPAVDKRPCVQATA